MREKQPLLVLAGPTAVGKTALSVQLAKALDGEIVSADSVQVYRGMDIGSAKIREEEMGGVPHHLIDVLDPAEEFHVVRFQQMAKEAIGDIQSRGKLPILTGGTGFYIQSVLYDIRFAPSREEDGIRRRLEKTARQEGPQALHERLASVDPASAGKIHPNNLKRVIRALEYYEQTGERISDHNERELGRQSAYDSCYFVLTDDRQALYDRIDRRVDRMFEEGLVEEVKRLRAAGYDRRLVSMQALGYQEVFGYLEGEYDLERAAYLIKRDTRHFAKRQLTWFRREKEVVWVDRRFLQEEEILPYILEIWRSKRT